MTKHQTNAINTSATSKQVREPARELNENELNSVVGGSVLSRFLNGAGIQTGGGGAFVDALQINLSQLQGPTRNP